MIIKADLDRARRLLEQAVFDGRYTPRCTPPQWWDLWAALERALRREQAREGT